MSVFDFDETCSSPVRLNKSGRKRQCILDDDENDSVDFPSDSDSSGYADDYTPVKKVKKARVEPKATATKQR
jgi:hypothetical protein